MVTRMAIDRWEYKWEWDFPLNRLVRGLNDTGRQGVCRMQRESFEA